ncbi:MAG: chromosome segregation protein, partial [Actinomycetota bacterium]|nr:chromosome segregation protein [Actinomycetota bacterium]
VPQQPVSARVAVETLRRDRSRHDQRIADLRAERDLLAAHDPVRLREAVVSTESARAQAEEGVRRIEAEAEAAAQRREETALAERVAAEKEAAVNKSWRDASTHLDELRQRYESEDRLRGDIERRIKEAERLLEEGHQRDPSTALGELSDDDDVQGLEKRAELVQRRLALLGRVNLLATGELESMQERHDFMQRELEDVRKARRDLLEVIGQVDREITETFDLAFKDVALQFERLIKELFPGGEGRLVLTDPANPLEAGIEIEASPGRKRVKRISLLSGGERSLTAMAFLFAIFTARPSPFYLMDEVEPALDDVNLHRFLRLVEGFASQSQVLIVTHQKRTMEIAGMLYGISLNKDGTTKVVCQTLEHPETTLTAEAREAAAVEASREEETAAAAAIEVPEGEPVH